MKISNRISKLVLASVLSLFVVFGVFAATPVVFAECSGNHTGGPCKQATRPVQEDRGVWAFILTLIDSLGL